MSIYDDMRSVADELFEEFKQGVIQYVGIVSTPGASPDEPATVGDDTPVTLNATARPVSTKYVNGSSIVETDIQFTVPNDGKAEPKMTGYMTIDGVRYKIIAVRPRPAAGDPITWTVIVRR